MEKAIKGLRFIPIAFIKLYQYIISPILGPRCRFHPSCSHYAIDAIQTHNPFKAAYLIIFRLLRCHPFHPGGFDPVPKKIGK